MMIFEYMIRVYADASGQVYKVNFGADPLGPPDIEAAAAFALTVDPFENLDLAIQLHESFVESGYQDYAIVNNILFYNGQELPINPPGRFWPDHERKLQSETQVSNIPGWATWNTETANDWYQEHVTDLLNAIPDVNGLTPAQFNANAQAIVAQYQDILIAQANVIQRLGQMVIALRNNTWPNLEENDN